MRLEDGSSFTVPLASMSCSKEQRLSVRRERGGTRGHRQEPGALWFAAPAAETESASPATERKPQTQGASRASPSRAAGTRAAGQGAERPSKPASRTARRPQEPEARRRLPRRQAARRGAAAEALGRAAQAQAPLGRRGEDREWRRVVAAPGARAHGEATQIGRRSSAGQSTALVMRGSRVRIPSSAPGLDLRKRSMKRPVGDAPAGLELDAMRVRRSAGGSPIAQTEWSGARA